MTDGVKCWPSGVAQCGSVHTCPVCCAKIKARRADEIEVLCDAHALGGGSLSMLTATVRHDLSQSLDEVRSAVGQSWRRVQRLKSWSDLRVVLDGHVVAPEVTFGQNGWHPHLHVLLFVRRGVESSVVDALLDEFRSDWIRLVNESLGKSPSIERGVHLLHFGTDSMKAAAGYLSKVAKELTASDLKSGRDPFTLLDGAGDGDSRSIALWFEYAAAMKGVRSVAYSKGLRELYAVDELEDDDVIELDEAAGVAVCFVRAKAWNKALREGAIGDLLSELELSLDPLMLSSA
ncbi:MAG: protein rep [Acidimicrobiales bacterium]